MSVTGQIVGPVMPGCHGSEIVLHCAPS